MKMERLTASCQHKRRYFFVPLVNQASQVSKQYSVNPNAFCLDFFVLFEIFWVFITHAYAVIVRYLLHYVGVTNRVY